MSDVAPPVVRDDDRPRNASKWALSLAAVLAVHGVAFHIAQRMPPVPPIAAPPAVTVELAMPEPVPIPPASEPPKPVPPPPIPVPPPPPPPKVETPPPPSPPKVETPDPIPVPLPKPKPVHIRKPPPPKPVQERPLVQAPPPVSPPPGAIVQAAPAPAAPQIAARFASRLLGQLNRYKQYPEQARRRGQTGVATLRFTLDRDGRLLDYSLVSSSGHDVLDEEVLDLVQRAAPYPPLPPEIEAATHSFTVPINFGLH
jgi:protein TonB